MSSASIIQITRSFSRKLPLPKSRPLLRLALRRIQCLLAKRSAERRFRGALPTGPLERFMFRVMEAKNRLWPSDLKALLLPIGSAMVSVMSSVSITQITRSFSPTLSLPERQNNQSGISRSFSRSRYCHYLDTEFGPSSAGKVAARHVVNQDVDPGECPKAGRGVAWFQAICSSSGSLNITGKLRDPRSRRLDFEAACTSGIV